MFEAFEDYYRPVHVKRFEMVGVPEAATRLAMLERERSGHRVGIPGELIDRIKRNPKLMLAPVLFGVVVARIPRFPGPEEPVP